MTLETLSDMIIRLNASKRGLLASMLADKNIDFANMFCDDLEQAIIEKEEENE
jgi:hypothetical protein